MYLTPEDLTIFKNTSGDVASALGFPINSCLLQQNMPLMFGGGSSGSSGKKTKNKIHDYISNKEEEMSDKHLAVPAGLLCMQITMTADDMPEQDIEDIKEESVVADDLYEQLLLLATGDAKKAALMAKKLTKRAKTAHVNKVKTRKHKNKK